MIMHLLLLKLYYLPLFNLKYINPDYLEGEIYLK